MLEMSEPLDLLLMPGLAFDWRGHRCGRGGGYYDKFLSLCQDRAAKCPVKSPLLGETSHLPIHAPLHTRHTFMCLPWVYTPQVI